MSLSRIASALITASALTFSFSAAAETKAPPAAHHAQESAYPMKAETFKKLVDGRLDRLKAHLEQGLAKRSLSSEQKAEIEKAMDGAVKELHSAVDKVGADGTVSREEAKQIKALSETLRNKMRAELRGKHANANAKGGKHAKAGSKHKSKGAAPKKAEKSEKSEKAAPEK
jgi:uncharacterized protein YajQ (UPF0234 family)